MIQGGGGTREGRLERVSVLRKGVKVINRSNQEDELWSDENEESMQEIFY